MYIRPYVHDDEAELTELTIATFGPFYEDSSRPLVGETIFTIQHGSWREDYRALVAELHAPEQHRHVAVAETEGGIAGYVGWNIDAARKRGCIEILAVADGRRRAHLGTLLCEHAFDHMRAHGAAIVEIGTGGDEFHAPARALYESLGCIKVPTAAYVREL